MPRASSRIVAALLVVVAPIGVVVGDPTAGAETAQTCLGCHGVEGYRNTYPSYHVPKIGGQSAAYLEEALVAYREGRRDHPTMSAQAGRISEEDIRNVAAFFAGEEQP